MILFSTPASPFRVLSVLDDHARLEEMFQMHRVISQRVFLLHNNTYLQGVWLWGHVTPARSLTVSPYSLLKRRMDSCPMTACKPGLCCAAVYTHRGELKKTGWWHTANKLRWLLLFWTLQLSVPSKGQLCQVGLPSSAASQSSPKLNVVQKMSKNRPHEQIHYESVFFKCCDGATMVQIPWCFSKIY